MEGLTALSTALVRDLPWGMEGSPLPASPPRSQVAICSCVTPACAAPGADECEITQNHRMGGIGRDL